MVAAALPVAAQSQAPQVDPDSPAGTEYELPIDRARDQASGGRSGGSGGSSDAAGEAPLFGTGVERKTLGSGTEQRSGGNGPAGPTTTTGERRDPKTSTPRTIRAQATAPDDGGSGLGAMSAGAAGVLLIGGLAGLAWRRRSMRG